MRDEKEIDMQKYLEELGAYNKTKKEKRKKRREERHPQSVEVTIPEQTATPKKGRPTSKDSVFIPTVPLPRTGFTRRSTDTMNPEDIIVYNETKEERKKSQKKND